MKKNFETLSEAVNALQKEGYTVDFNLVDEGLHSKSLQKKFAATQFDVIKVYRFEGYTNPDDNSVLYVIETKNGDKGILVDAYGVYAEGISDEMIDKLKIHE